MAGFFNRIFKMGQSEAHNLVDKLEDPIKLSEQAIRDLKKDLEQSMQSLAEVKANYIRMKREAENNKSRAADYERKAMLLLQKGQDGSVEATKAESLAIEAINEKEKFNKLAVSNTQEVQTTEKALGQLQGNVEKLKTTIKSYENDLTLLKTRARTAAATKKLNKQLSTVDSSSTISLLERMKTKVEEDEALAEAYGSMIETESSVDAEIEKALLSSPSGADTAGQDKLAELKAKMGIS